MAAEHEDWSMGSATSALGRGLVLRPVPGSTERGLLDDALLPPLLTSPISAGDADLYALSADADLIETLRRAGGAEYPVFQVQEWAELEAAVVARRCGIALLDVEIVGNRLAEYVTTLGKHASRVVTLVAGDRQAARDLMGYLSERKIHRLLVKPPALGITRVLLESATRRCLQLRALATVADKLEARALKHESWGARLWSHLRYPAAGGALAVAAVVGVGWLLLRAGIAAREPLQPLPVASAPSASEQQAPNQPSDRFADLLAHGAEAFEAGRLATPIGDSALDDYLAILAADPDEATARTRLAGVVDALFAQAESALLANALDDAGTVLTAIRRADPASSRLAFLSTQWERAGAARAAASSADKSATTASAAAGASSAVQPGAAVPTELDGLLVIARARLARGQLLDPRGDSALEYLRRANELNASDARVARGRRSLAAALLDAARRRLGNRDLEEATRLIAAAKALNAPAEELAVVELDLESVEQAAADRRRSEWLGQASSRLRAGALTDPSGDSALDYLRKLQAEAPGFAGLGDAWAQWVAAQAARARASIASRDWAGGQTTLADLASAPGGAALAAPLRERLEVERLQAQYLADASPPGELQLVAGGPPSYPLAAREQNIEGWVELEYVVDRTGRPTNLVVLRAEPTGLFEDTALATVARYRYAPFERGGHVYERRIRVRVRFTLN